MWIFYQYKLVGKVEWCARLDLVIGSKKPWRLEYFRVSISTLQSPQIIAISSAIAFDALKNKTICVQGDGNSRQFYHALVEILSNHSSAIPVNKNGNDFCNARK